MSKTIKIDVLAGAVVVRDLNGKPVQRIDRGTTGTLTIDVSNAGGDHPEAETPDAPWQPLEEAVRHYNGKPLPGKDGEETWRNDLYTVTVSRHRYPLMGDDAPDVVHLSIRRNDRHWARDWRHFQLIKNQLVGSEHEGMELYPAESRMMDMANQYHLWVLAEPGARIPVGYEDGRVTASSDPMNSGARQRPLPEGTEETVGEEQAAAMVRRYLGEKDPALLAAIEGRIA